MVFNPSGSSVAFLNHFKKKTSLNVGFIIKGRLDIRKVFFKDITPISIAYSSDSRFIYISESTGKVLIYDSRSLEPVGEYEESFPALKIRQSRNGFFLAANDESHVTIRESEDKKIRKSLTFASKVVSTAFSSDNEMFAVLTEDGTCNVYETQNYGIRHSYQMPVNAKVVFFHPQNKYLVVSSGEKKITLVNLFNDSEKHDLYVEGSDIMSMDMFTYGKDNTINITFATPESLIIGAITGLSQNRAAILKEELSVKMDEWMRQMPGESLEEYESRVNEENRQHQMQLFELEIATAMAGDMISGEDVSFGSYSMENGLLAIEFSTLPAILLPVSEAQLEYFTDPSKLEFNNTQYCINSLDEMELVYAEVTNTLNGQVFTFDNRERHMLDFMSAEAGVITLEQLKSTKMEEMRLEEIKDDIINTAKNSDFLTDHTHINVSTKVKSSYDASGKNVLNYDIDISYNVDEEYSSKDDFPAGKYKVENSNAAQAMLSVVKKAFDGEFAKYLVPGKKVEITIKGAADASPVNSRIPYDGCYGEYEYEPVFQNGELTNVSVTKASGITTNEQLAFLRALGVKDYLEKNISGLKDMKVSYSPSIEVSEQSGSEFRRIGVRFSFIEAL